MKDLFYSPIDKRLFWIAGYTDNSFNVKSIISTLKNNVDYFLKQTKLPKNSQVKTNYIFKSSRYKSMRYYWVDDIKPEQVTAEAFQLGDYWTMYKWIEN